MKFMKTPYDIELMNSIMIAQVFRCAWWGIYPYRSTLLIWVLGILILFCHSIKILASIWYKMMRICTCGVVRYRYTHNSFGDKIMKSKNRLQGIVNWKIYDCTAHRIFWKWKNIKRRKVAFYAALCWTN